MPSARELVVIETVAEGRLAIKIEKVPLELFAPPLAESLTVTVNVLVPAAVGVPVILPELFMLRPAGSLPPVMLQEYGGTPLVAVNCAK